MRVFVAGASGAIGEPLIAALLKDGHSVVGMTTNAAGVKKLESQGAGALIANAFHVDEVAAALQHTSRRRSSMN